MSAEITSADAITKANDKNLRGNDIEVAELEDGPAKPVGGTYDAVWGELGDNSPNYRNLGWIRCFVILVKSQIGLGVLGIVSVICLRGATPCADE